MKSYRFYRVAPGGKILAGQWVEARDVDDAVERVRALCRDDGCRCEIWDGGAKVAEVPCGGRPGHDRR